MKHSVVHLRRAIVPAVRHILIWCVCAAGPATALSASAAPATVVVTNAESSLALTAEQAAGPSMTVQAMPSIRPPLRIQVSTNLAEWVDWKFVTNETAQFTLASEGIANPRQVFFRTRPLELDLTKWKLTLPVNTSRAGSPDEVKQPELATFQDPEFFHANPSGRGIVLRAPTGGITTSNSVYPRSELLEVNGKSRASWSTTSGTHTLEIVQAITHLPEVKPSVAAGQIHDLKTGNVILKLNNRTLALYENGVRGPVLTTKYNLGDPFSLKLVARNGGVEYYYNGGYVSAFALNATNCYFKAGCYTLSNTNFGDLPTAYGEVVIYGLTVTHDPPL